VIRHGDGPILGLQSHPETKPSAAQSLLFLQKVFRDWGSEEISAAFRQTPRDDEIIGVVVGKFLATGRPP